MSGFIEFVETIQSFSTAMQVALVVFVVGALSIFRFVFTKLGIESSNRNPEAGCFDSDGSDGCGD